MKYFIFLYPILLISCANLFGRISPFDEIKDPVENIPQEVLISSIPIKGKIVEVFWKEIEDDRDYEPLKGELITIRSDALIINLSKDDHLLLKSLDLKQIDHIKIYDFIEKYNATFYGSFHWIFLPVISISNGIFMLYSVPSWIWQIIDASIFGLRLNQYQFDIDENFDFEKLKGYARYPHQIPKEIQRYLLTLQTQSNKKL